MDMELITAGHEPKAVGRNKGYEVQRRVSKIAIHYSQESITDSLANL